MPLLAFEAAGQGVSVALGEPDEGGSVRIIGSRRDDARGAGDRLVAHTGDLLRAASLDVRALSGIAVDRGPGSFTGVRTAVAAGRGLALASGKPVYAFTRFELLASVAGPGAGGRLVVALRAGRERVLIQVFGASGQPLGPPEAVDAAHALGAPTSPILVIAPETVDLGGCDDNRLVERRAPEVDAQDLLRLAVRRVCAGLAPVPPFELEPMYSRPPDAIPPRRLIARPDDPLPAHARPQA